VPVFVELSASEEGPHVALHAKVETNPQLKSPLQQVSIATTLRDATTADVDPPGGPT
jgi:hypothetical protein